jgi:hypothetical protein
MSLASLVATVVADLDEARVPFMITGSFASAYHGEPRSTRDLDMVIDPDAAGVERLVAALQDSGLYVDADAARSALVGRTQFNAIAPDAWKVDFIVRKERPFSRSEFARRRPADLLGTPGFIATVEDMVVAKLEWAAASGSERQLQDVRAMLDVSGDSVDVGYVEGWVSELGLREQWEEVRR